MQPTLSEMVLEFHVEQDILIFSEHPAPIPIRARQLDKMQEEWNEVQEAINSGTKEEIAHELADLMYTIVGTALVLGIMNIEKVFVEVHKANMTKGLGFDKSNYTKPEIKV